MGLLLQWNTEYGVPANYWCVWRYTSLLPKSKGGECKVTVHGFVDKASRDAGAQPIAIERYEWKGADYDFDEDANLTDQVYEKIKAMPTWRSAINIFEKKVIPVVEVSEEDKYTG